MTTTKEDKMLAMRNEFAEWSKTCAPENYHELGSWEACAESYEKKLAESYESFDGIKNVLHDTQKQLSEANARNAMLVDSLKNFTTSYELNNKVAPKYVHRAVTANSEAVAAWEAEKMAKFKPDVPAMVVRFLSWRLPKDFSPDCGISFERNNNDWPVGTNLLNGTQATDMIHHILGRISNQDVDDMCASLLKLPAANCGGEE